MSAEPTAPPHKTDAADPDELMRAVTGLSILKPSVASLLVHLVLIVVTSIGFVSLCVTYGTWHPKRVVKKLAEEERERQRVHARGAARAKLVAEQERATETKGKSRIEKAITDTSDERPAKPDLGPDDLDDLD